jgi:hypothetical protein
MVHYTLYVLRQILPTPDYMAFIGERAEGNADVSPKWLEAATSPVELASVIHFPPFYANRPSLPRVTVSSVSFCRLNHARSYR